MKIGLYISPAHAVPPLGRSILAPWILVSQLADGLVARGHTVSLFAARGSKSNARVIHGGIDPTSTKKETIADSDMYRSFVTAQELALMREAIIAAKDGKLDILHIHQPVERLYPALLAMPSQVPVVITFHDPISAERFPALETLHKIGSIYFVSLSKSQRSGVPFPFAGVVHNGIDIKEFVPDDIATHDRPLLITGRIVPQKGFSEAITVARKAGIRLMIVGKEYEKNAIAHEYFEQEIRPQIDGKTVFWESVVSHEHLIAHYQKACALLFPIHWEEPFGLVMVEAMACGTPVVAYGSGSVPEIVRDGVTGSIVDEHAGAADAKHVISTHGIDGLVEAVRRIPEISRSACRKHVMTRFTLSHMTEAYEALYRRIVR